MTSRALVVLGLASCLLACSSTNGGSGSDAGPSQATDAGVLDTTGGMDFTFSGAVGANTTRTVFQVGAIMGSFCMASGNGGTSKSCSFTGSIYANGCLETLNVAFTGPLAAGTSFPFVADAPVPEGKGYLTYSVSCGSDTKAWRATAGSVKLDSVTPPPQGLTTGKLSFTVTGATMAPAHTGGGTAQGTFDAAGSSKDISYTGT